MTNLVMGFHCQNYLLPFHTNIFDPNFEDFYSRSVKRQTKFLGILRVCCFDTVLVACNMAQNFLMHQED
jgi:hypothetical protein